MSGQGSGRPEAAPESAGCWEAAQAGAPLLRVCAPVLRRAAVGPSACPRGQGRARPKVCRCRVSAAKLCSAAPGPSARARRMAARTQAASSVGDLASPRTAHRAGTTVRDTQGPSHHLPTQRSPNGNGTAGQAASSVRWPCFPTHRSPSGSGSAGQASHLPAAAQLRTPAFARLGAVSM